MSYTQILTQLPTRLRPRFESLGRYVKTIVDEEQVHMPRRNRLKRQQIELLQTLVFVHVLNDLFKETTAAAMRTVMTFEELGVSGFSVGQTDFVGRNENVMRGERLSEQLMQQAGEFLPTTDENGSRGLRQFIKELIKRVQSVQSVD